ncbi:hypothetical protein RO3G_06663 [Rhizopus delemar RA 99-880]|uniref:Uncharacterized protein n=1 Tax=Rhizopus delemar (strain RA 99-880 / ATCC MYA-4621 / FGSC 9543 / NRRL 43880) TaxID=246409 RepID=I1C0H8_RHIO9|nr:hypothetical protein RO3G_06663 [Rhizopus delemar RA 99-880]|eukprot:EIE81958.1 hypothetical protein RO3G_06663 [Rhizopus delemar RA 99-880]
MKQAKKRKIVMNMWSLFKRIPDESRSFLTGTNSTFNYGELLKYYLHVLVMTNFNDVSCWDSLSVHLMDANTGLEER